MIACLVTGADGFIGRNLALRLGERPDCEILPITRRNSREELASAAARAEVVFHLAGVNRPQDPEEFGPGNLGLTQELIAALQAHENHAPIVYSSSTQADAGSPYGASKRAAEDAIFAHAEKTGAAAHVFRLPNVFGKWSRPNYNSAVATFCHNIARAQPIKIHDADAPLKLVYIDDVIAAFLALLDAPPPVSGFRQAGPVHETTVGEVAEIISGFAESRSRMLLPAAGEGLVRALYATYLSHVPSTDFEYRVPVHGDARGVFVEMAKTPCHGQFSYFTAEPGVTRGDHYHHTKVEKFLVMVGRALFAFRHVVSGETHEVEVVGGSGTIVETIPGWTHNITNVGEDRLVVMLWANEIFDPARPDTVAMKV